MTPQAALVELLERLGAQQGAAVHVGSGELNGWPVDAVAAMKSARLLVKTRPASSIVCPGCERECAMPVEVFPTEKERPARAFIFCDKPEDMGRIPVALSRLEQWQMTGGTLAGVVARLLGFSNLPQTEGAGKRWGLGLLKGKESKGTVTLSIENGVTLALAGQSMPLVQALTLSTRGLKADKDALLRMVEGDARQPASGVGSAAWRKQTARTAANARYDKPGGLREKKKQLCEIWASGKYTSRDRCAEEECGALGIPFSTARKALKNTPAPKRSS